jgi:hypothetical protein
VNSEFCISPPEGFLSRRHTVSPGGKRFATYRDYQEILRRYSAAAGVLRLSRTVQENGGLSH